MLRRERSDDAARSSSTPLAACEFSPVHFQTHVMIGFGRAFCRPSTLSSLLAKGTNTALGQVQVQMVAVGLVSFGAQHRRKDAAGALVHLAQEEGLLRCAFPASVGERPRIAAHYVGLSRHLRLRLQIASGWTPG